MKAYRRIAQIAAVVALLIVIMGSPKINGTDLDNRSRCSFSFRSR